ncbi:MAG: penicillin-binding transpeptidase domain-containing protein, partial [Litorilinea sp.]
RRAPHFVQYVIESLDSQLGAGYTRRAGLSLITTLDLPMQEMAQTLVQNKVAELRPEFDMNNGALVALSPAGAEILTMVGSADFNDATIDGQVNVATSLRQPGSAIKPILFAAALENGIISPASIMWDTPVAYELPTGEVYTPHNYDRTLHGPVTVRHALANSYNIPAVKLLDRVGVSQLLEFARDLGLRSLDREAGWYGLSLAVGGGEVRLLDLTAAFQPFANGGQQLAPRYLLSMTNNRGQQMLETPQPDPPVITPATAFLITDILSDNTARSPAFGVNSPLVLSRPAAVKTGTTDDWRDNLTVGYTRHLVAGVWVGNTDGSPTRLSTGITGAAPIWQAFMEAVLADPARLARLGAPPVDDDAGWVFAPPPDVTTIAGGEGCPPHVICREQAEFFSQAWLAQWGDQGPLADSVIVCNSGENNNRDNPQMRALLLPGAQRLPPAADANPGATPSPAATVTAPVTVPVTEVTLADQRQAEQDEARRWSEANRIAVSLGDCAAGLQLAQP